MRLPSFKQLAACKPYQDIEAAECKVKRNFVLDFDEKLKIFHINGVSFKNQVEKEIVKIPLDSVEEWTLTSNNGDHPFHIHVNPFQVVLFEDLATKRMLPMEGWLDTVVVNKGKRITIRMKFRDFTGKTVWHCHTLDHEDQGMMRTFWIGDATAEPAPELTACAVPAPPLKLPSAQDGGFDLSALGQKSVILVFFQGMSCPHCTQELKNLLREASDLAGTGTIVVAVSSLPIALPDKAVESLGVPKGLGFRLLVDEGHLAFRAFGCYDTKPRHGLFLIDKAGTIRARYVGDAPFADAPAVRTRVRQLLTSNRRRAAAPHSTI